MQEIADVFMWRNRLLPPDKIRTVKRQFDGMWPERIYLQKNNKNKTECDVYEKLVTLGGDVVYVSEGLTESRVLDCGTTYERDTDHAESDC